MKPTGRASPKRLSHDRQTVAGWSVGAGRDGGPPRQSAQQSGRSGLRRRGRSAWETPEDCPRGVPLLPSLDALLDLDIQMCVVAIPAEEHENAGLRLAGSGVAALIEKPLAVSWDEGSNLVDAFEAAGVVAATGLCRAVQPRSD